ncbi:hypothetical protein TNCV_458561 [Trichonephila clavipes]|nr:hypothetical protein TNCV_458561 [Trichonephila clavipes]
MVDYEQLSTKFIILPITFAKSRSLESFGRLEGGQTQAEVAQAIVVSQSVSSRIWNRFLETGSSGRRPGKRRKRATTSNEDCYLV